MITQSTWWVIKHQDLKHFSWPRLDLMVHVIILQLLPRVTYNLNAIMGQCQIGRGAQLVEWQKDLRHDWKDMPCPDNVRNVDRELQELCKPGKTKGRAERLANICADADEPPH